MEVKLRENTYQIEILKKENNKLDVMIDDRRYELDILKVENDIYSVIYNGKSFDLEVVSGKTNRNLTVAYECMTFDVEIIDPQAKYFLNRKKSGKGDGNNAISSPMPGKVVKIPVSEGDQVEAGDTVIIISAMKMESEYKAPITGTVKKIHVSEGDIIEGGKTLIVIE
jgi:biotin carboxyl carrier protein